jgi:arsenite methyltransferase
MKTEAEIKTKVRARYAGIAVGGGSCCAATAPGYAEAELESLPQEAVMGLGCGSPTALASLSAGETVLDLGSGGGIDVFLAAQQVGPAGKAVGVDMTPEMIERARKNAERLGLENVEFRLGELERLPVETAGIDVVISNCVINLLPDKRIAFQEAFRVLKTGGRLLVADIVSEGEVPEALRQDGEAWSRCIGGAEERERYLALIREAGFERVEVLTEKPYACAGDGVKLTSLQVKAIKGDHGHR